MGIIIIGIVIIGIFIIGIVIMDARVTQREQGVVSAASDLLCSSFNFFPFNLDDDDDDDDNGHNDDLICINPLLPSIL